jgi:hypothetical protein
MATLVCILSKETLPNISFIKEFKTQITNYIFFTSKEMEDLLVSKNIINSLKLDVNQIDIIEIDANSVVKIDKKLNQLSLNKDEVYFVNITGGNKLMSTLIFDYFKKLKSTIYYSPINYATHQILYPEYKEIEKNKSLKVSLDEYLNAYGYEITSKGIKSNITNLSKFFEKVIKHDNPGSVNEIKKATFQNDGIENKEFYMGGWFEEFLCETLMKEFQLNEEQIGFNIKIKNNLNFNQSNNDQEIDVLFIYNNTLHAIECKVYLGKNIKIDKISTPMFKLAAITNNLGLSMKKYVCILGDYTTDINSNQRLDDLAQKLKINKVMTLSDFKRKNFINRMEINNPSNYSSNKINEDMLSELKNKFNKK